MQESRQLTQSKLEGKAAYTVQTGGKGSSHSPNWRERQLTQSKLEGKAAHQDVTLEDIDAHGCLKGVLLSGILGNRLQSGQVISSWPLLEGRYATWHSNKFWTTCSAQVTSTHTKMHDLESVSAGLTPAVLASWRSRVRCRN